MKHIHIYVKTNKLTKGRKLSIALLLVKQGTK